MDLKEIGEAIRCVERIFMIRIEKSDFKKTSLDEQVV
jgi:hypothetical protein